MDTGDTAAFGFAFDKHGPARERERDTEDKEANTKNCEENLNGFLLTQYSIQSNSLEFSKLPSFVYRFDVIDLL